MTVALFPEVLHRSRQECSKKIPLNCFSPARAGEHVQFDLATAQLCPLLPHRSVRTSPDRPILALCRVRHFRAQNVLILIKLVNK
jgi:hypothetical protein